MIWPACLSFESEGGAEIELLEEMKRLRLRPRKVVPTIFPREAINLGVELLLEQAKLDARALNVLARLEAAPKTAQMLPPGRGGGAKGWFGPRDTRYTAS